MSFLVNKKNKIAITDIFAIKKLKGKKDSIVVDCSLGVWLMNEKNPNL